MSTTHDITRNLGGDRLGSGNKMSVSMHGYNRSTHNLSKAWRSSMNVGTLVPCYSNVALPGDTWSIDLATLVRTVPATGPMYGAFKMQVDFFQCPIRLYNGLLHNNMLNIGMKMNEVLLPTITLSTEVLNPEKVAYEMNNSQIAPDSLLAYLGLKGLGSVWFGGTNPPNKQTITREINGVPIMAYYDVVKNYYCNKQEKFGYYIGANPITAATPWTEIYAYRYEGKERTKIKVTHELKEQDVCVAPWTATTKQEAVSPFPLTQTEYFASVPKYQNLNNIEVSLNINGTSTILALNVVFPDYSYDQERTINLGRPAASYIWSPGNQVQFEAIGYDLVAFYESEITIKKFLLDEVDDMRIQVLQNTGLNVRLSLNSLQLKPIVELCSNDGAGFTYNKYSQLGLALKTYQSDVFTNWVKTEWIEGPNGINAITAVDTSAGSFTIDALNLAKKVYNMLNRVAVSGGSYEDYIEAVYSTDAARRAETPIYLGGMSTEIVFNEVVSTAPTETTALGDMAGKGTQMGKRGGKIECKVSEPSYIMGIVSITPLVDYSQGNHWDLTELMTMDDLHKPALDGIGFEDLLMERFAWFGRIYNVMTSSWERRSGGKVPAWVEYMTDVNETFGDFAKEQKAMFMTLNRRYEFEHNPNFLMSTGVKDFTTYIDPTKYNYCFADTDLAAQNFWVQIGMDIVARRVMSAKQIPNM